MLPVLDGLLPSPHNEAILDLVFVMGCWHAYAKLRLHTELTLASFEQVTANLGTLLRHFTTVTCNAFKTKELPREKAARLRRATTSGTTPAASAGAAKPKGFNLSTYKLHALGDYPRTIRERGTTDNYTTGRVGTGFLSTMPLADLDNCRLRTNTSGRRGPIRQAQTNTSLSGTLAGSIGGMRFCAIWKGAVRVQYRQPVLHLGKAIAT